MSFDDTEPSIPREGKAKVHKDRCSVLCTNTFLTSASYSHFPHHNKLSLRLVNQQQS